MKIFISNINPRQTESVPNVNLRIKIGNRLKHYFHFVFFFSIYHRVHYCFKYDFYELYKPC